MPESFLSKEENKKKSEDVSKKKKIGKHGNLHYLSSTMARQQRTHQI